MFKNFCLIISVFIMSFAVGYKVLSWTGPTGTAPASNASAPINVSSTAQTKSGTLAASIFYDADDASYYVNPSGATSALFSGKVGIGTTSPTAVLTVAPPAAETIAAAATITANACGTIKQITAAASVTTGTANTFTAPAATQAGCCMIVHNVNASYTITLDANANFKTSGAADVAVGPYDSVTVCSTGTYWFQATALLAAS